MKGDAQKDKVPALLEDVQLEMKPADARKYIERSFQIAIEIAEGGAGVTAQDRLNALRVIDWHYQALIMKDSIDEAANKVVRAQNRATDEVRRLRKKDEDWNPED